MSGGGGEEGLKSGLQRGEGGGEVGDGSVSLRGRCEGFVAVGGAGTLYFKCEKFLADFIDLGLEACFSAAKALLFLAQAFA